MQIEIQLDDEQTRKLTYIQQQTQQNATELIDQMLHQAIDQYYQQIQPLSEAERVAKFKQSKFAGCFEGSPDLSTRSKEILHSIFQEKFSQHREE